MHLIHDRDLFKKPNVDGMINAIECNKQHSLIITIANNIDIKVKFFKNYATSYRDS